MSKDILMVEDLSVAYGNTLAVKGLSFSVQPREIIGVIGPNGAGKTTLLETIAGLHEQESGNITFDGAQIEDLSVYLRKKRGITLVPQERAIFPGMTVRKNLEVSCLLVDPRERESWIEFAYEVFPRLKERKAQKANTLSGGERKMLAVSMGLVTQAKLLLVDEPSSGLAPKLVTNLLRKLEQIMTEADLPIVLAEQDIKVLDIADRVFGLEAGESKFLEVIEDLGKEKVKKLYLGIH